MKKDEIQLDDWNRILWGMAPPEFFIEVLFRTLIIYVFLLIMLRLLGKRMNGQLSITEMGVMLVTGAVISPSMQAPDRGIALGIFAMMCTLFYQRITTLWSFKSKNVEKLLHGTSSILIKEGIILIDSLKGNQISHQQLFTVLRNNNIYNLGEVKRLYLESAGVFSIYPQKEPRPGLSSLPPNVADEPIHSIHQYVDDQHVCKNCGYTEPKGDEQTPCPNCQARRWTTAIL